MKAYTTFDDGEIQQIQLNTHKFEFGGHQGNGYCYGHQSFKCFDSLTEEELDAVQHPEEKLEEVT